MTLSTKRLIVLLLLVVVVGIIMGADIKSPDFMCSFYGYELLCLSDSHPLWVLKKHREVFLACTVAIGLALWFAVGKKT